MKARLLLYVLFLVCLTITGCKKNEFKVDISLPAEVGSTYTIVYYASDSNKGWIKESAVSVHGGKGKFVGLTRNPTLVYFLSSGGRLPATVAYAERGDKLEIKGESSDPLGWEISGNKLTEQLSEWRRSNREALQSALGGSEESTKALNEAVAKSVKSAPGEPVSALLLYVYYDRRADSAGFYALKKLLKEKAAEPEWAELAGRSDMIGDSGEAMKVPEKIVLRTIQSGCDTLSLRKLPTLIYYSQRSREDYNDEIEKFRELSREFGDSGKRVLVNVSIDPDSMNYAHSWRRDSLKATVQAWAPLGLSDDEVMKAGVRRIPWVMVVDPKGKAVYSGPDMGRATEAMRGLLK